MRIDQSRGDGLGGEAIDVRFRPEREDGPLRAVQTTVEFRRFDFPSLRVGPERAFRLRETFRGERPFQPEAPFGIGRFGLRHAIQKHGPAVFGIQRFEESRRDATRLIDREAAEEVEEAGHDHHQ